MYIQTWPYISRLYYSGRVGKWLGTRIQSACGLLAHEWSDTEWGYSGGDSVDVWCRWCNYRKQIPFAVARDYWPDLWQETRELRKNNPPDEVNDG